MTSLTAQGRFHLFHGFLPTPLHRGGRLLLLCALLVTLGGLLLNQGHPYAAVAVSVVLNLVGCLCFTGVLYGLPAHRPRREVLRPDRGWMRYHSKRRLPH